jgi:START domain
MLMKKNRIKTLKPLVCLVVFLWGLCLHSNLFSIPLDQQFLDQGIHWELVRDESGIRVFLGDWPGSDFTAFRSDTVFDFSLDALLEMIRDIDAYGEWMPDCDESRALAADNDHAIVYYLSMDSPWPIKDRDWVNRLEIKEKQEKGGLIVEYKAYPGFKPEDPDKIRVHHHYALWVLIPIEDNKTRSVWYGHSEPGGWVPSWLTEFTIDQMILDTTLNMKKYLARSKNR